MCGPSFSADSLGASGMSDATTTMPRRAFARSLSTSSSTSHSADDAAAVLAAALDECQDASASHEPAGLPPSKRPRLAAPCLSADDAAQQHDTCARSRPQQPGDFAPAAQQQAQQQQAQSPRPFFAAGLAAGAPPASPPPPQLLVGTSGGLFAIDLATESVALLGLDGIPVGHVCCAADGRVLACCPVLDDASSGAASRAQQAAAVQAAGLYALRLPGAAADKESGASSSDSGCSGRGGSPFESPPPCAGAPQKLWQGNARCAAFAASACGSSNGGSSEHAPPRLYLGCQPADLLASDDGGASWASCGLSGASQSGGWFRRLPPYEPSVRSISSSNGGGAGATGEEQLLVAVEVGGALLGSSSSPDLQPDWAECSQGLCRDIQALQPDPCHPRRLYAVAGSGSLPGGIYRSKGRGQKWKRLFGYRYPVGMAASPHQKGRLLLVCADKPPEIGCNLFESSDGGRNWLNLTDLISEAATAACGGAPGLLAHAPVATFVPGGLVLACVTGHVLLGAAAPGGGYSGWRLLAQLPCAAHCCALSDGASAPAAISRG